MAAHGAALIAFVPNGKALMRIVYGGGKVERPWFVNLTEVRQSR